MDAIVYISNTGFTKRYAELLSEKTGLPLYELEKNVLKKGSDVIFLGWLFASNIKGYKAAAKKYNVRLVCGVGLGDSGAQTEAVRKAARVPQHIPLFTLQGGMYRDKLKGINRFMIDMLVKMLDKKTRTADENKMLSLIKTGGDYVNEADLIPVLKAIGEYYKQ